MENFGISLKSWSFTGGGRLRRILSTVIWRGEFLFFLEISQLLEKVACNKCRTSCFNSTVFSASCVFSRATSVSAIDGKWHHICATWENTAGSWKLYKDGVVVELGQGLQKGTQIILTL